MNTDKKIKDRPTLHFYEYSNTKFHKRGVRFQVTDGIIIKSYIFVSLVKSFEDGTDTQY